MDTKQRKETQATRNSTFMALIASAMSIGSILTGAFRGAMWTSSRASKRRHSPRSFYGRSEMGRKLSAAVHRHGSPERVGFRRSDDRHPRHALHVRNYHADGICNCTGRIQRRDVPQRLNAESVA